MTKINHKSDFEVVANWIGEGEILPFILEYAVGTRTFTASYNGSVWRNCKKEGDKRIRVFFDNHRFGTGKLMCTLTYWLDNDHYPDGKQTITNVIETDIVLVNESSDEIINDITLELTPNYQRGYSAYDIAVKNGFEGSEEEWLDSLHANITLEGEDILVIGDKKFKLTPYVEEEGGEDATDQESNPTE